MDISASVMEIQELGYTVIKDFMTEHQIEAARSAIGKIEEDSGFGSSDFGGHRTVRSFFR